MSKVNSQADGHQMTPEISAVDVCSFFLTNLLSSSGDNMLLLPAGTPLPSLLVSPSAKALGI